MIKCRYSIVILWMIILSGVGAKASTPSWTVNPSDYRYDMSLYLDVTFASGKMDYSQYEVAAFCNDECRGIAERLSLTGGKECLYLRARSNQESGESMTFKYYNNETGETLPIEGVSFQFVSNGRMGYPSDPFIVRITRYYDVNLSAGIGGQISHEGGRVAEGTELTLTATPDEGYHFEQWSDGVTENPRKLLITEDISLGAEFGVNTYKLVYKVDGVMYKEYEVDYGTSIVPEALPEKEGHTFSGWEGLPETMPAHDVTATGSFSINSYKAVFKIEDVVIETKEVVYGQPVEAPEAPAKEGHTFAGWQDVPETMPAHDIEILGSYTVNQYKLTYMLDGVMYKEVNVAFGSEIVPEVPEKEGHTFSGWEGLPETMPAHDVTATGSFSINSYKLTVYVDDVIYMDELLQYGAAIQIPEPQVPEGKVFDGWDMEIPETMPAHDLEIHGTTSDCNGIENVFVNKNELLTIYTMGGVLLFKDISVHDAITNLDTGLYLINGKKVLVR